MRYYRLILGNDVFDSLKSSTPLNINFDIQIFQENASQIVGSISIINPSLEYYLLAQSYIGKTAELHAGFIKSPLTKKLGYKEGLSDLIFRGLIMNVLGEFSGIESKITFYFLPFFANIEKENFTQENAYSITLNNGDNLANKVTSMLSSEESIRFLLSKGMQINVLNSARNLIWRGNSVILMASTVASFLEKITKLSVKGDQGENVCMLYRYDNFACLNFYASGSNDLAEDALVLTSEEFITQPQTVNIVNGLTCVLRLRADLYVGKIVSIEGVTPQIAGDWTSMQTLTPNYDTTKIFHTGTYLITSVNHLGEFYNSSESSWTTQIECTPLKFNNLATRNIL